MPEKGFEELAAEVVKERGALIRGFRIERIESSEHQGMTIHCLWTTPERISLAVELRGNESNDEIKAEIWRQLEPLIGNPSKAGSESRSVRVLLVEDDPLFVRIISAALGSFDVVIDSVRNAESAVRLLREKRFDTLITDLHMEQMSGADLVAHVLKGNLMDPARILVLTGERDGRELQWAKLSGVRVLYKPVTSSELEAALRTIV